MNDNYDKFKTIMEENTNGQKVEIRYRESDTPGVSSDFFTFVYVDFPRTSLFTAVTYGVSLANHEDWSDTKPEFMLTTASSNQKIPGMLAFVSDNLRGKDPFKDGFCVVFNYPICEETDMKGVCFGGAAELPVNPIPLNNRKILVRRAFLIYEGEAEMISKVGWKAFVEQVGKDRITDIKRTDLSGGAKMDMTGARRVD
jgi:hypothetical protein